MLSHPIGICVGDREERSPTNKKGESQAEPFSNWGLWNGSLQPLPHPSLCTSRAAQPTLSLSSTPAPDLTALTSLRPGSATHPVLVGIDRGISNSPSKPGHVPRLQRRDHHQEPHLLPQPWPYSPSPPLPTLTVTTSPRHPPPLSPWPGQEQTGHS